MRLLHRLLDDAAMFPPGDLPLHRAVPAHTEHRRAPYGALVGPLVVAASAHDELADATAGLPPGSLAVALTVPVPRLGEALAAAGRLPAVRVVAVEVSLPDGMAPAAAVDEVGRHADGVRVFVVLPRDDRREPVLAAVAGAGHAAKLRTGGPSAADHPDEEELAAAVVSVVRAGVAFKATAGLHHAVRNTDAATGFEQHGFLNLLLATAAAGSGAGPADVARLLAERDPDVLVTAVRRTDPAVRERFRSFGTCSITEPVDELARLGLVSTAAVAR
jgi:hypothetical protein